MTTNSLPSDRAVLTILNSGTFSLPLSHGVALQIIALLNGKRSWNAVVATGESTDILKAQAVALRHALNGMELPLTVAQAAVVASAMAAPSSSNTTQKARVAVSGPTAGLGGEREKFSEDDEAEPVIYLPDVTREECQPIFDLIVESIKANEVEYETELTKYKDEHSKRGLRGIWEGVVVENVFARLLASFLRRKEGDETVRKSAENWGAVINSYGEYASCGEHLYHFRQETVRHLIETPLGKSTIDEVRLPKSSFYIHFGDTTGIVLDSPSGKLGAELGDPAKFRLVGAYVSNANMKSRTISNVSYTDWLSVVLVAQAFSDWDNDDDPSLEGGIGFLLMHPAYSTVIVFEESRRFDEAIKQEIAECKNERRDPDYPPELLAWSDGVRDKALNLVAKSLLFISENSSAIEDGYEAGAPEELIQKAKSRNSKNTARRAAEKLRDYGFRKVKFVGLPR